MGPNRIAEALLRQAVAGRHGRTGSLFDESDVLRRTARHRAAGQRFCRASACYEDGRIWTRDIAISCPAGRRSSSYHPIDKTEKHSYPDPTSRFKAPPGRPER